jgi:hypothetical protein
VSAIPEAKSTPQKKSSAPVKPRVSESNASEQSIGHK